VGNAAKIAVSIDAELLRQLERVRARTGESRSAAVSRALRILTQQEERARRVVEYERAYRETPETDAEISVARELSRRALAALPWESE